MPPLHAKGMVSQCALFYWGKNLHPSICVCTQRVLWVAGGQFHLEVAGLKLEAAVLLFGCV